LKAGIDPETGHWDWTLGRVAFLDFETTGIWDPADPPLILEAAMVVTDGALNELGRYSAVVDYEDQVYLERADPFVVEMHTKSGLWNDLKARRRAVELAKIEADLCATLEATYDENDGRPVVWAGFSPSALDRPLARHFMPAFYDMLHYRTIDVSTLKLYALNYHGVKIEKDDPTHRAEQDVEDTIETFGRISYLISKKAAPRRTVEPVRAE
jgi:oligoribonuclease